MSIASKITLLAFAALSLSCASAATRPNDYSISTWWKPSSTTHYPDVHVDHSITFHLKAPQASHVELLFGEWDIKPQPMTRDQAGDWTVTIGPVEPEIYSYLFSVDGTRTLDLGNPRVKAGTEVYGNIVEVPGTPPRFDEIQNVPHGMIEIRPYLSTALHRLRHVYIFLPPDYGRDPTKLYPVLYLRHGGGDSEASWSQDGRAGVILENLLSTKEAVPMIIVMTNGMTDGSWAGGSSPEGIALLERELMEDVIPLVEKNYRVSTNREDRAITGLSMGGGQAFVMGLHHLDRFAWVGEFSAGLLSAADFNVDRLLPGVLKDASVNQKLRLLWLGCGKADPRYNGYANLVDLLQGRGIAVKLHDSKGGHEWKVWRHQLHDFLQVVFR